MKVEFGLTIGLAGAVRREKFDIEELGYSEEAWNDLSEEDKIQVLEGWANNYIETWFEESN